jgi:hypothetical protein
MPTRRTVPWAAVFRGLAERYHWTPSTIAGLTMYEALVYLGYWCPEDIFQKQAV